MIDGFIQVVQRCAGGCICPVPGPGGDEELKCVASGPIAGQALSATQGDDAPHDLTWTIEMPWTEGSTAKFHMNFTPARSFQLQGVAPPGKPSIGLGIYVSAVNKTSFADPTPFDGADVFKITIPGRTDSNGVAIADTIAFPIHPRKKAPPVKHFKVHIRSGGRARTFEVGLQCLRK